MRRVFIVVLCIAMLLMNIPMSVEAADVQNYTTCSVEDNIIKVAYKTAVIDGYEWKVTGWCITGNTIDSFSVPEEAPELGVVTNSEYTEFTFNKNAVYNWAIFQGISPDYKSGTVTVYAQPVIAVRKVGSTDWIETDIKDLKTWYHSKNWKNRYYFKALYNQKIAISVESGYVVRNVFNKGNHMDTIENETSVVAGKILSIKDLGVEEVVKHDDITYVMSGINIENAQDSGGSVHMDFNGDSTPAEGVYSLQEDSTMCDVSVGEVIQTFDGYYLTLTRSGVYELMENVNFRMSEAGTGNLAPEKTYITVEYTPITGKHTVYGKQAFLGYDTEMVRMTKSLEFTDASLTSTITLNELNLSKTVTYGKTSCWQLNSVKVYGTDKDSYNKKYERMSLTVDGETVDSLEFAVTKKTESEWLDAIDLDKPIVINGTMKYSDYVVEAEYVLYIPQIELYYYRDENGNLTLFKTTSKGNMCGSIDSIKKNLFGTNTSKFTFTRFLENESVAGKERNLALTKCYAYTGPQSDAVAGYGSSQQNCWDVSSLPSNGACVKSSITEGVAFSNDSDVETTIKGLAQWTVAAEEAYKQAFTDNGELKTVTVDVGDVPETPLIYVSIYEACPEIGCVSYYTTSDSLDNSTTLTRVGVVDGQIEYDSVYSRTNNLTVGYSDGKIDAATVYAQDGVDNGLKSEDTMDGSGATGSWTTTTGKKLYFTRYAWVTGEDTESVKALGSNVTWKALCEVTDSKFSLNNYGQDLYLEGQKGYLIKIFTPSNAEHGITVKEVLEAGKDTSTVNEFKSKIFRNVLGGAVNTSGLDYFYGDDVLWQWVNAGVSESDDTENVNYLCTGNDYSVKTGYQFFNTNAPIEANSLRARWFIYRKQKAYTLSSIYRDENGALSSVKDNMFVKLSPLSGEITVSVEPFVENKINGSVCKLQSIYYGYTNPLEHSSVVTEKYLEELTETTSNALDYSNGGTVTGGVITVTETVNATENGEEITITGNTQKYNLDGNRLSIVAVYTEYIPPKCAQIDNGITTSLIQYRDTISVGDDGVTRVCASPTSYYGWLNPDVDARFQAFIENDLENSSDGYVASLAIPTTEYLRTYARVPKYLVDIDYVKSTTSMTYQGVYYGANVSITPRKDDVGNEFKEYDGTLYVLKPAVTRTASNYSLHGATIWTPTDVTIENPTLPTGGKDVTFKEEGSIVLLNKNTIKEDSSLGIVTGNNANFFYPNYQDAGGEEVQLYFCNGVYAGQEGRFTIQQAEDVLDGCVGDITAINQEVIFNNGEGISTVLCSAGDPTINTAEPIDAPAADYTDCDIIWDKGDNTVGAFSSKNDNTVLPWLSGGVALKQQDTSKLQIAANEQNGIWTSKAVVRYEFYSDIGNVLEYGSAYNGEEEDKLANELSLENKDELWSAYSPKSLGICFGATIKSVVVLTPVVTNFSISDERQWDQSITDKSGFPLILDRPFSITTSTIGTHCYLPGYGEKDYKQYIGQNNSGDYQIQVKFPFTVSHVIWDDTVNGAPECYAVQANAWYTIGLGTTNFILPSSVKEDDFQSISVRTLAVNATTTHKKNAYETAANYNYAAMLGELDTTEGWNYASVTSQYVSVEGRVYGLEIIDVGDYPLWENVFRTDDGDLLDDSSWDSGLADQNGMLTGYSSNRVFPMVDGDHPSIKNEGFTKAGYVVRFKLETVGELYNPDDVIEIVPKFYWISEETGERTEAFVYYNDDAERGIRVGSTADESRLHYFNFANGKFGVSMSKLQETSSLLGYSSFSEFSGHSTPVYSFGKIQLNQYNRTFDGLEHLTYYGGTSSWNLNYSLAEVSNALGLSSDGIDRSIQTWYGQYYLPAPFFVTTEDEATVKAADPNFNYYDENGELRSIWKSDGYLVVSFANLRTVNAGQYDLGYNATYYSSGSDRLDNDTGLCNMWNIEMSLAAKQPYGCNAIKLEDGDFLIYDMKDVGYDDASTNYEGGGTH